MLARRVALNPAARRAFVAPCAPRARMYTSTPPPSLVSVLPFKHTPEEARGRLMQIGLAATASPMNILLSLGMRLFGADIEPIGRELGLASNLKLTEMKAAYYPVWVMDLLVQGKVTPTQGGKAMDASLALRGAHIPGNAFAPLSYISFQVAKVPKNELKEYNPREDLNQFGSGYEIIEVPFNVSPFGVLDSARRKVGHNCHVNDMRIDERDWKTNLAAAYPVMVPIYVAEFEFTPDSSDESSYSYRVVMHAGEEQLSECSINCQVPPKEMVGEQGESRYWLWTVPFVDTTSFVLPKAPFTGSGFRKTEPTSKVVNDAIIQWMAPMTDGDSVPPSPTLSVANNVELNWFDARIQRWMGEEAQQNQAFLDSADSVARFAQTMVSFQEMGLPDGVDPVATVVRFGKREAGHKMVERTPRSKMMHEMETSLNEAIEEMETLKPQWLIEYEIDQETAAAEQKKKNNNKDSK